MKIPESVLLNAVLPILQGLLASGHYTAPDTEEEGPKIHRCDNGADWKWDDTDNLYARRHTAIAVEDAISIARELIDQIKLDEKNRINQ